MKRSDIKRFTHINFVMDDVHSSVADVYESLADADYNKLDADVKVHIEKLRAIVDSYKDDIQRRERIV